MGPKFLASPVLLALVFDLLTPLSFLSHPRSHSCLLITYFICGRRTHWLSPFSLSSEIMGRMIRHPTFCTASPTSQECSQFQAKEAGRSPHIGTLPEKINRPPHSCIFSLHFFMEKAELSEFRCPVLPRLCK